jgi:hypothetical protein
MFVLSDEPNPRVRIVVQEGCRLKSLPCRAACSTTPPLERAIAAANTAVACQILVRTFTCGLSVLFDASLARCHGTLFVSLRSVACRVWGASGQIRDGMRSQPHGPTCWHALI